VVDEILQNEVRKFLREVGVTSHQEIEAALAGHKGPVRLRVHLTSPDIALDHVVERTIGTSDQ
jgi:hypothetical protein